MFITLEGPDGGGKTTLARSLAEVLKSQGREVVLTREPGGSSIGPALRTILLEGGDVSKEAELFLFLADRAAHVNEVIKPALVAGKWVICDRFVDSTMVYQGAGRGFQLSDLRKLNEIATGGLMPKFTLLLDVPSEVGIARQTKWDRLDQEPLEFHKKVRQGFLDLASAEPERIKVLQAEQSPDEVLQVALTLLGLTS